MPKPTVVIENDDAVDFVAYFTVGFKTSNVLQKNNIGVADAIVIPSITRVNVWTKDKHFMLLTLVKGIL